MRLVFFGTPEFAVPTLRALLDSRHEVVAVVAQPDRPAGRGMKMQSPPVAELAHRHHVRVFQPPRIRDVEFLDQIKGLRPAAGVVVAYGKILPKALLTIPNHGFFNVHASLLPKYRGAAPIQRAIEHGESETGVTIMRVDEELDHGPILSSQTLRIADDERAWSLSQRLSAAGAARLVEALDQIEAGTMKERGQDHAAATYAAKIEKEEGRVRWDDPARAIVNKWRAFDPWPGLFTEVGGENVKLTAVSTVRDSQAPANARPGQIVAITSDGIDMATGEGILRIAQAQRAGKRAGSAAELARAFRLEPGAKLG